MYKQFESIGTTLPMRPWSKNEAQKLKLNEKWPSYDYFEKAEHNSFKSVFRGLKFRAVFPFKSTAAQTVQSYT